MRETFVGVMPLFCAELVRISLIVLFPWLTLALPAWLSR